jgi:hypothetical protein
MKVREDQGSAIESSRKGDHNGRKLNVKISLKIN